MFRYFSLLLAFGCVIHPSHGTEVMVKDKDDKLCLYANLMVNFSVSYEAADNKSNTVQFELPANVMSDGSKCEETNSMLKLDFGAGHSWSVKFTINGNVYQADSITFSYNLSDSTIFPKSASNETVSVIVRPHITDVSMDTCYSCNSKETIQAESVNQTLWNVLIQAFISNGTQSKNLTTCAADLPTPTPTAPDTTTVAPVTNVTTSAPPSTTTPTPTLPTPSTGNYSIKPDENSTACLLANFGLRIGVKQGEKYQEINLDPNRTSVSGSCGGNSSELVLVSSAMTISFAFTNDTKKFRLQGVNVTAKLSSGTVFSEGNSSLSLWEASVGSSYMCNKEQNYTITGQLNVFTFDLQVQPFEVKKGLFSTAEECFLDSDLSFLVPIAVGVALSFLIVLVLISYLIGRRKSRTGYQSV
ncbi:lysosome-associated membrane glycoprotein 2 isoform X1 [Dunckerocampus dactyliophorus]|uniref:lysosome-associated membrane glycoprotein 2 isoform X1 n=1 Tax=Dunckerocampus dactyliophorus TaxID=161453 RepID=UPI002404D477|nr:lysosome-associated membrane glycoprotein 2 isoform X1 [Dunckerocampus dactyliophorus]